MDPSAEDAVVKMTSILIPDGYFPPMLKISLGPFYNQRPNFLKIPPVKILLKQITI